MVTWRFKQPRRITADGVEEFYGVGDCLSTDDKPTTGIFNGSVLREMDTKTRFKFDAEGKCWREYSSAREIMTGDEVEEVLEDADT